MIPIRQRFRQATINYGAIVLVAASAFSVLNGVVPFGSRARSYFWLFGPAVGLFGHLGVWEFAFYSLFVFPWLLVAGKRAVIGVGGFAVSWLGAGWSIYGHSFW